MNGPLDRILDIIIGGYIVKFVMHVFGVQGEFGHSLRSILHNVQLNILTEPGEDQFVFI